MSPMMWSVFPFIVNMLILMVSIVLVSEVYYSSELSMLESKQDGKTWFW